MSYKKSGVHLHGSPLHKFLGMDGKQWGHTLLGVGGGVLNAFVPGAGTALQAVGGSLIENNMEGADEKAARQKADFAADMA